MTTEMPTGATPDPQGPTLEEAIANAEARGDYGTSGLLKMELLRMAPETPEPTPEEQQLAEEIQAAEQAEDFETSMQLKALAHQRELLADEANAQPPIDPQLQEKIREAEESGDDAEALRLKWQAVSP